jgi:hypothetical protein
MPAEFLWTFLKWLFCFVILILISKYAIDRVPLSRKWAYLFLIVSYVQGLLFSLTFKIPINFFPDLFTPIPVAVMFSIFYFLLFLAMLKIFAVFSNESKNQSEDCVDNDTINYILDVWNLKSDQIKIIIYDDGDCPGVHREISKGNLIIHVGKNFLKLINKSELIFTLSHEVAHFKGRDYRFLFIIVSMGYIIFICLIGQLISAIIVSSVVYFVITTFIFYILGLMAIHYLSWHEEFSADYYGAKKIQTIQNFESIFQIKEFFQHDHGLLFDLIFFDHPSSDRRIKNILKIKKED